MHMKFVKLYELKIFTAEDVLCGDEPFYKAVFKEARRLGLGGGTLIRADAGYGQEVRGKSGRAVPIFFSGSYNLPLIIEIVDTKEKLATLYPFLEKNGHRPTAFTPDLLAVTGIGTDQGTASQTQAAGFLEHCFKKRFIPA